MSLYNMMFEISPSAGLTLEVLKLTPGDIPRFRDAYFDADENKLVIYTRTGGGNREYYGSPDGYDNEGYEGPFNSDLEAHPNYIDDQDDDFDCTYAYFNFSIPDEFKPIFEMFKSLGAGQESNPTEKFAKMIEDLQAGKSTPETERALEVGKSIVEQITKALDGNNDADAA
jgi:hypothetical protein